MAWPFPVNSDPQLASIPPTTISYSERVQACLRHNIARTRARNEAATTLDDRARVEDIIAAAQDALAEPFEPCFVMEDYKEGNLVVQDNAGWHEL